MTGCTLVAPELTSIYNGAKPTFSFKDDSPNCFGFQATYMSGSKTCPYSAGESFVPVFKTAGYTATCSFSVGSTKSSIVCSNLPNTGIPAGAHTLSYISSRQGCDVPETTTFIVGPSPTPTLTETVYNTIRSTATATQTAQASYTSTVTSTKYDGTTTSTYTYGSTIVYTDSKTSTRTSYTSSCPLASSDIPSNTDQSSSTFPPTPTGNGCPGSDTKTIKTPKGDFVIECYHDRYDSDMRSVSAGDFDQCVQACARTDGCVDVSYVPNGPCYLKNGQQPGSANSDVWGARLAGYSSSAPTTATTTTSNIESQPTASRPGCPENDGSSYYVSGKVFQIQCGIDHSGGDLQSGSPVYGVDLAGCINACATTSGCVDISLSGTACYLKGVLTAAEYDKNVAGAVLVGTYDSTTTHTTKLPIVSTTAQAPKSTSVTCPEANMTTFTGSCGSSYVIECGFDRSDSDLSSSQTYSLDDCINACDLLSDCVDVSWVYGSPGTCYFKGAVNAPNYVDYVWGARKLSSCASTAASPNMPLYEIAKLKLHRKRVVKKPFEKLAKRTAPAKAYSGPDYTFGPLAPSAKVTKTATKTATDTVTITVTPKAAGTTTTTVKGGKTTVWATVTTKSTTTYAYYVETTTTVITATCPATATWVYDRPKETKGTKKTGD